jgi:hypothetical protein
LAGVVVGLLVANAWAEEAGASSVTGIVRDPAGRPIPSVWITREDPRPDRRRPPSWTRTDADGRFRVDGLAGDVVLRVVPGDPSEPPVLVPTRAGARDVLVTVDPGPQLFLRIADYAPGEGQSRYARLVWTEPDGRKITRYSVIRSDGWLRFVRLPAGRPLELWAVAGGDRVVRQRGLRAGEAEVKVAPAPGGEIRGRLVVPAGENPTHVTVRAEDPEHRGFDVGSAKVSPDGSFVIRDLPRGTYRVSAWFASGKVSLPVVRSLATGATDAVFEVRR